MRLSWIPALIVGLLALLALLLLVRAWADRSARRTVRRFRSRIDRYKLTRKSWIVGTLLQDEEIALAVREHSAQTGAPEGETWTRVRTYLDEIVPYFSILAYYRFGYAVSRVLLNLLYKVTLHHERGDQAERLPPEATVIYLINHRSNADYVLVAYALAGDVSLSYAVGEWARAFPLEYIFKSFGSYFIRRRYREPLYHTVLRRYVQLITREGVTQGIFPEGGLSRDGALRPGRIGLLDYALSVAREPGMRGRLHLVPVALNYDRVLEDRSLLAELASTSGTERPGRLAQLREVSRYVSLNLVRLATGRWRRYGRAAVVIGSPIPVSGWLDRLEAEGVNLWALPRDERLGQVQRLCDDVMERIGRLVPVTPVPLVCAALESFRTDHVPRDRLLARIDEMRQVLSELNAQVLRDETGAPGLFERAYRMLRMRRVIAREGDGYLILPRGRPLLRYYANSISQLLGSFATSAFERDAAPLIQALEADGQAARLVDNSLNPRL